MIVGHLLKKSLFAAAVLSLCGQGAFAQDEEVQGESLQPTPIVQGFENFPFPVRVPRGLYELEPVGEPYEYERRLPFLGAEAAQKGIIMPEPYGASALYIYNWQKAAISDLSVALSLAGPPPQGTELVSTPFVTFNNVESETDAGQFKLDAWVLPFMNAFISKGRVTGGSDIQVSVDVDEFIDSLPLPPVINPCPPRNPCGTVTWPFTANIDSDTYTLGLVGVKNWGKNVATFNGSYTFSDSRKATAESVIEVATVGAKYGRLITLESGATLTPYVGVNYTYSDNIIRGTATSPDGLLPAGQNLSIRFEARQKNISPWSGTVGFSLGVSRRWNLNFDLTASEYLKRAVFGATMRF
ncbi:MAG: hypothetical protein QNJ03_06660 [Dinoroseobacter sp.]|nr:hypothetical protein [Dinoroseobacter sp.]